MNTESDNTVQAENEIFQDLITDLGSHGSGDFLIAIIGDEPENPWKVSVAHYFTVDSLELVEKETGAEGATILEALKNLKASIDKKNEGESNE